MKLSYLRFFAILLSVTTVFCGKKRHPGQESRIDPCDPASNLYEGDKHYIERDFVNEDGILDYSKWFEVLDVRSSHCDPLKRAEEEKELKNTVAP